MTNEQSKQLNKWYDLAKFNVRTNDEKHKQIAWYCFEAEQAG